MTYQEWLPIAAAIIGGGAAGAIITAIVTSYRNRVQPVALRMSVREMFSASNRPRSTEVKVIMIDDGANHEYDNLHEITIDIQNSGNVDREVFTFGVSLGEGERVVFLETKAKDRHHKFSEIPVVSPSSPTSELDFSVAPFNRGDVYSIVLYAISEAGELTSKGISFSSPSPVKFGLAGEVHPIIISILKATPMFPGGYIGQHTLQMLEGEGRGKR